MTRSAKDAMRAIREKIADQAKTLEPEQYVQLLELLIDEADAWQMMIYAARKDIEP